MSTKEAKAVSRAIAVLNRVKRGWRKKIDVGSFKIKNPNNCILGQIYGSFVAAPGNIKKLKAFYPWNDRYSYFCDVGVIGNSMEQAWKKALSNS